jgi:hypothetical protein
MRALHLKVKVERIVQLALNKLRGLICPALWLPALAALAGARLIESEINGGLNEQDQSLLSRELF